MTCNCPLATYDFAGDCYACSANCNKCNESECTECASGFNFEAEKGCVDPKAEKERLERCGPNCDNCGK